MTKSFGSLIGSEVLVYVGDIIVLASDVNTHMIHQRHVSVTQKS